MTRRRLAALAVVALTGAGCGSDDASGTASGAKTTTAMKFAQCMRDHGVGEFPDPDASGTMTIDGVVNGSSIDTSAPSWKQAIGACRKLQPAGFTGRKRSAEEQDGALAFAQCIRENGVEDFPDPTAGAPLVDTRRIPSAAEPGGMDVLNAAMQTCGDAAADAGVER